MTKMCIWIAARCACALPRIAPPTGLRTGARLRDLCGSRRSAALRLTGLHAASLVLSFFKLRPRVPFMLRRSI